MLLSYTAEQRSLASELRGYFSELMTPEIRIELDREEHGGPVYRQVIRQLGVDGWLGVGWPEVYGGQGRGAIEQFIFYDETQRARVPIPMIALNTVGPTLMESGSPEQKQRFLPAILRGEIDFAIGYTEADAGTDLAALRTRAEPIDGGYTITGTKLFTSRGGTSDYVWLAARTGAPSDRHRSISIFIVETTREGFSSTPIETLAGYATYATYYDRVFVPAENLVGTLGRGWQLITTQLNHERVAMAGFGGLAHRLVDDVAEWAAGHGGADGPAASRPWVQRALARCRALLAAMRLLNLRVAWLVETDRLTAADASAAKVFGTEAVLDVYRLLMEVVGQTATVRGGPGTPDMLTDLEWAYRRAVINTFGGGTNEVQREIIATTALGLPRAPR